MEKTTKRPKQRELPLVHTHLVAGQPLERGVGPDGRCSWKGCEG